MDVTLTEDEYGYVLVKWPGGQQLFSRMEPAAIFASKKRDELKWRNRDSDRTGYLY